MLRPSAGETLRAWLLSALVVHGAVAGNPDAKRLYDDLLSNYNKLVRPVVNTSDVLRVCIKLKLSQLIDVQLPIRETSDEADINPKKEYKGEENFMTQWDPRLKPDFDSNRIQSCGTFPFPNGGPYGGVYLSEEFIPRKLNQMGDMQELHLRENSSDSKALKRKVLNSPHASRTKKKGHKANRLDMTPKKFKNVESMNEFKKLLENFRILDVDESKLSPEDMENILPAYFVLKLAEKPGKNSMDESHSSGGQSLKLVFANDEEEDSKNEKAINCPSRAHITRQSDQEDLTKKDKTIQTLGTSDVAVEVNKSQDLGIKSEDRILPENDSKCLNCLKREDDSRVQKEFNASLLEQIKSMLTQLSAVIGLLNNLLIVKNVNTGNNDSVAKEDEMGKGELLKNFCGESIVNFLGTPDVLTQPFPIRKNLESSYTAEDSSESEKIFRNNSESIGKEISTIFCSRKQHKDIIYCRPDEIDRITEKRLRRKIESGISDMKFKSCCRPKPPKEKPLENFSYSTKKNRSDRFREMPFQRSMTLNGYNEAFGGLKNRRRGPYEEEVDMVEEGDYEDSGDETENVCINVEMVMDDGEKKAKEENKNQVLLISEEAGYESNCNDAASNEDNPKLSCRTSSVLNLKNQIMTTNLWVEQSWYDYKLRWDPKEYGGVHMLHVPSDHIWRPDIVLYNNADGNFEVTLATKATIYHQGLVEWKPPAIYKSSCEIDVEYFPFDEQTCVLKFGSWTYDGFKVDLRHMDEKAGSNVVEVGVDLSEFYMSVEWDILEVPAVRNEKFYTCCDEPYLDITFNITMRRKTLFYTVNIIIPCMGISFLTVLTFYLPSDSGEKVTLSISILISLHVFFLLVVEIIPPTSLVVPLLGKYLIFAMILVSISICVTVVVLNVHFRSPQTHRMAPWVKRVFIHILPRLLVMRRPQYQYDPHRFMSRRVIMQTVKGKEIQTSYYPYPYQTTADNPKSRLGDSVITRQRTFSKEDFSPESLPDGEPVFGGSCQIHGPAPQSESEELSLSGVDGNVNDGDELKSPPIKNPAFSHSMCPPEVHKSCFCVRFIAEHTKMLEDSTKVKEDWKYVAMVLDRLFLWIFTLAVLVGTAGIILQAPTLYDDRIPIDKQFAEIQTSTVIRCPPQ